MKKIIRCLSLVICTVLVFSLVACGEKGLSSVSKNMTTYTINATLNDQTKTLVATQEIDYYNDADAELSEVWFHLYANAYRDGAKFSPIEAKEFSIAYPNGLSYGSIQIASATIKGEKAEFSLVGEDNNALSVKLNKSLMPYARVKILLEFTLTLPNMRHRLGYFNKTINLGNWYPVACVYEDGEFNASPYYSSGDPFYLKSSNYNVSITAPKAYTIATTGANSRTENGETAVTTSSILAARDFAAVLGEYTTTTQRVTLGEKSVAVKYYYYNDEQPELSLKAACDAVSTFSNQYINYPYDTLSVTQTSFNQGGMEYTSLVFISDLITGQNYRDAIIHETAHQWWYGIVGNSQVSNAWLDEGLSEFSTSVFYELNPDYKIKYSQRIADAISGYTLFVEISGKDVVTSMNRPISEYKSNMEYAYMTYVKGQLLFDALRNSIGDKALFGGLKSYCQERSFKIAQPDHLIASLEKSSGVKLKTFFESWLQGTVLLYGGIR